MKSLGNKNGRQRKLASRQAGKRKREALAGIEFVEQTDGFMPAEKVGKHRSRKR